MLPKLIDFHGFFIPTYGVILFIAVMAGLTLLSHLAKKENLPHKKLTDACINVLIGAFLGSKLTLVLISPKEYLNPARWWDLLRSGGVFLGGFITGVVIGIFYFKKLKLPLGKTGDLVVLALSLGQGIGRWACFSAGCCYGKTCQLPWAVVFHNPDAHAITGVPLGVPIHPTQIYHSLAGFLLFGILFWRYHHRFFPGEILGYYLVGYGILRFIIEFFRGDPRGFPFHLGLSTSQWLSSFLMLVGVTYLIHGYKKAKSSQGL